MPIIKKIGQLIIFALAGYFIFRVLFKNWVEVRRLLFNINISLLLLSLILMAASFAWQTYLWSRIIVQYGATISFFRAWQMYMKAAIIRYIPGNIWGLAAKGYMITTLGLKKSEAFFIMIFESAVLLFSALVVYLLTISSLADSLILNVGLVILAAMLLVFLIFPKLFLKVGRLFQKNISIRTLPWHFLLKLFLAYVAYWIISGLSIYYLLLAMAPVSAKEISTIIGIFAISWTLGFISIILPSGLGVREASLVFFLSKIISFPLAATASILSRIVYIIGEIISLIAALISHRFFNKNKI